VEVGECGFGWFSRTNITAAGLATCRRRKSINSRLIAPGAFSSQAPDKTTQPKISTPFPLPFANPWKPARKGLELPYSYAAFFSVRMSQLARRKTRPAFALLRDPSRFEF